MKVQTVTITIGFDPKTCAEPENWKWHDLLDLGSGCWMLDFTVDEVMDPTIEQQKNYDEQEREPSSFGTHGTKQH